MLAFVRRGFALAALLSLLAAGVLWAAPEAQADVTVPLNFTVNATTHLARLNMDVAIPQGTFTGAADVTTGTVTGNLSLPPGAGHPSVLARSGSRR